ncbi:MAG: methionine biosynthesis protein MetW [Gammaproteobacteria bacterium]|nr:methionine biosynthesis protein MetW [Gammaproteobacteria bacterium]MDH5691976.1 methionine biosynthesis protein MetW [Gammaproteobacteria bacterium]
MKLREDLKYIAKWVPAQSCILDLGCGDGSLLAYLKEQSSVDGYGLEIDEEKLLKCVEKGVNVIQRNIEDGLGDIETDFFDVVVMSQTLQAVRNAEKIMDEMLRVGREVIITFPNFGHWRSRLQLTLNGRMPVTRAFPHAWYNTPNIHVFTLRDFEEFCRAKKIVVTQRQFINPQHRSSWMMRIFPNLAAPMAIYRLKRL